MDSHHLHSFFVLVMVTLATFLIPTLATLTPDYYDTVCPQALPIIKSVVKQAIIRERRIGASLLRLHFHDCFVNGANNLLLLEKSYLQLTHASQDTKHGCDGSVLLDDTPFFIGEKTALPNNNSIRGFDVVDEIKAAVDRVCKRPVVSCADILAIAARDSVAILGGRQYWYKVLLGRRDARNASRDAANLNLPAPFLNISQLISNFQSHGLDLKDLVVLSGGHTIGFARCSSFQDRIFNDTNIDQKFAATLRKTCPLGGDNNNLAPLDASTPARVDTSYYTNLLYGKGLLHSDQELYKGDGCGESDRLVQLYSNDPYAFARDFGDSMIKMGNMKPLTGTMGEVRCNCRRVN